MSNDFSSLFGSVGSARGSIVQYELIRESKTITALEDGYVSILIVAGHGSGALAYGGGYASGAGAGECAMKLRVPVKAGQSFVAVIGAGGPAKTLSAAGRLAGDAGGVATIVGPGVDIQVNGGQGGQASATLPCLGGAGGRGGSGGDMHFAGGDGGDVIATSSPFAAAGSGAVGILKRPAAKRKGGSVNAPGIAATAGAGAGVGGVGGTARHTGGPTGGGSGGDGADSTTAAHAVLCGANFLGRSIAASPTEFLQVFETWGIDVFGGGGSSTAAGGPGGGGSPFGALGPGVMGGAGGCASVGNTTSQPGNLGPGGSLAVGSGASGAQSSGKGDNGLVVLIFTSGA